MKLVKQFYLLRRILIISLLFFNYSTLNAQTYSNLIDDEEIYDFLNWMTANGSRYSEETPKGARQIFHKILSWDSTNFIQATTDTIFINGAPDFSFDFNYLYKKKQGTDTIFKQEDRDFIFKQFDAIKDSVWHKGCSASNLVTKKKKKPNEYHYSIPLFSKGRSHVIVRQVYYCGNRCAYGGYYVYRKLDDKRWEFVTVVNAWMS